MLTDFTEDYPLLHCIECDAELPVGSHSHKKYCNSKCKARYRKKQPKTDTARHKCRICGKIFPITKEQGNKWLCSDKCRKASNAKSVREFHKRKPHQEVIYRSRTRDKCYPDGVMHRFYKWHPNAPKKCEACGEDRVLEIAHKPGHERVGARRTKKNQQWPLMVWVLCPTCHRLLDRMNYKPEDIGL